MKGWLLFWWFVVVTGGAGTWNNGGFNSSFVSPPVGPFRFRAQCEEYRAKFTALNTSMVVMPCWEDR